MGLSVLEVETGAPILSVRESAVPALKRVRWKATIVVKSFGVRIGVRINVAALEDDVRNRLPHGWEPADAREVDEMFSLVVRGRPSAIGGNGPYCIYDRGGELSSAATLADALDALESHMQLYVAEMASNRLFLHAGVAGWGGRAIVLPGRSFAGKSTLVRELVRAGATYYSDEYAVLDAQGLVHPFTRPLGIRVEGFGRRKYPVETLGGTSGTYPIPVGFVLLCRYRARARWRPRRLSQGMAVLELLDQTVPARRKPEVALDILAQLAGKVPVFTAERGEAGTAVPRILRLMDTERDQISPSYHPCESRRVIDNSGLS